MFISVDLPEPDGPMMATNSPRIDAKVDARERADLDLAHRVDLGQAVDLDDLIRHYRPPPPPPPPPRTSAHRVDCCPAAAFVSTFDVARPMMTLSPGLRSPETTCV